MIRASHLAGLAVAATALVAASVPRALAPAAGGLWEVGRSAHDKAAERRCIANPGLLARWEHLRQKCDTTIVADKGTKAVIEYQCADGGFGHAELTLLTPRTIRVQTQGISGGAPFSYTLHARRIGGCEQH